MGSISKYGFFGTLKRVRRRKTEKSTDAHTKIKNKRQKQSGYDIQIDAKGNRNSSGSSHVFEANKIKIEDDSQKDKNKGKEKKAKKLKDVKKTNPNLLSFDHELTDFECKLRYINLKDLTGSEYGRFFPPVRSNLVIIDDECRKFSAIRAGNNQISGDILQFLNANGLKPGDKISFEYDREEKSDEGKAVVHLKKK